MAVTDVLIYPDTTRSPELRHEIPVGIGDAFLYGERDVIAGASRDAERVARHLVARSSEGRVRAASTAPVAALAEKQAAW